MEEKRNRNTSNALYLLINSSEDSINVRKFHSRQEASDALKEAYADCTPDEFDPAFEDLSYLSENEAVLYANGETVYAWTIEKVTSEEFGLERMETLESRDGELEEMWEELTDMTDPGSNTIISDFYGFEAGTDTKVIFDWFDARYSKGVGSLLCSDGQDRTLEIADLYNRRALCSECDSEHCAFNPEGLCMYPFLYGHEPEVTEEDGCRSFIVKEED